jgi:hypothetical protein
MAVAVIVARPAAPGLVASYVGVLWICEAADMVSLKGFTAVAYLPWLASRERWLGEMEATRG